MSESNRLLGGVATGEATDCPRVRAAVLPPSGRAGAVHGTAYLHRSSEPRSGVGPALQAVRQHLMPDTAWPLRSSLELGALPGAVSCARLHTKQVLWEWGLDSLSEAAGLLVSELTTNAIQTVASRGEPAFIRLRLLSDKTRVLIEVWDADPRPPEPKTLDADGIPPVGDEGGRGLFLVATLSRRWGWYPVREWGGKAVWAEVAE
jgi:anti-sigma regulatory factor (Ser/Thr protein kinase)